MQRIFLLLSMLSMLAVTFACSGIGGINGDSPTEAYKRLYVAVKSKDTEAIKKQLTKKTIELGKMSMDRFKKTEEQAFENGFTSTTFSETLPSIRDERVKDNMGAVEVWNSKESRWEDLPFINEDGAWKLAIGDLFGKTYKSPGKGRDQIEKEATNAISSTPLATPSNTNANLPVPANAVKTGPGTDKKVK